MNLKYRAFTLVEIILSMFITALLIAILTIVFNTSLRAYRQGNDLLEITRKAQIILGQMTRELPGAMVYYDSINGEIIPFIGNSTQVTFMAPFPNSGNIDLCEIGYGWNGSAVRRHFLTDSSGHYEYPNNVNYDYLDWNRMSDSVTNFDLRYRDNSGTWGSSWNSSLTNLPPTMISVNATIEGEYGSPQQSKTFSTWIYLPNSTNSP